MISAIRKRFSSKITLALFASLAMLATSGSAMASSQKGEENFVRFEGWNVYKNEQYKFEIGYPQGTYCEEREANSYMDFEVIFKDSTGKKIIDIGIFAKDASGSIYDYVDISEQNTVNVNGKEMTELEGIRKSDQAPVTIYVLENGDYYYGFEGTGYKFSLMLSTLNFTGTPEKPDDPNNPDNPDNPDEPDKPDEPENPEDAKQPKNS